MGDKGPTGPTGRDGSITMSCSSPKHGLNLGCCFVDAEESKIGCLLLQSEEHLETFIEHVTSKNCRLEVPQWWRSDVSDGLNEIAPFEPREMWSSWMCVFFVCVCVFVCLFVLNMWNYRWFVILRGQFVCCRSPYFRHPWAVFELILESRTILTIPI